jgi:hypothetical protein
VDEGVLLDVLDLSGELTLVEKRYLRVVCDQGWWFFCS